MCTRISGNSFPNRGTKWLTHLLKGLANPKLTESESWFFLVLLRKSALCWIIACSYMYVYIHVYKLKLCVSGNTYLPHGVSLLKFWIELVTMDLFVFPARKFYGSVCSWASDWCLVPKFNTYITICRMYVSSDSWTLDFNEIWSLRLAQWRLIIPFSLLFSHIYRWILATSLDI